jgi:hypothetical protein
MIAKPTGRAIDRPGREQDAAEEDEPAYALAAEPGVAGRQGAIAFDDRGGEGEVAADRQEQESREDREELAKHRILLAARRIHHAGKAEAHRVADRLAGKDGGRKADLDGKADRKPRQHFPADQQDALDRGEAFRRQHEIGGADRRDADRQRDHQPQLHRHERGAEHGRGEKGGAGADHRHHPDPELRLDAGKARWDHRVSSGIRAKMSLVKSTSSIRIAVPNKARQTPTTTSLGTKLKVASLIEVAAWTMPSRIPVISAGIRIGAEASARIQSACCAIPTK